jgi:hypothetical protein
MIKHGEWPWESGEIKWYGTENTGGNVMLDFIELESGVFIAIGCDSLTVSESRKAWENHEYLFTKILY